MQALATPIPVDRYAKVIEVSRRIRWDIDRDVIRDRTFDLAHKFLPDSLSLVEQLPFLGTRDKLLYGQVQGRTYANMFGLVERFIGAKVLELSRGHALGEQSAMEALVRFTDEELKHQELFRRIESLVARGMPEGYRFVPQANDVAMFVLVRSTWAVLALTLHIELFSQSHYRQSIDHDADLSPLFKDVFFFHWKEESQHAILDELEWRREDGKVSAEARDRGVDDLIALVAGIDELLQVQAAADTRYFIQIASRAFTPEETASIGATMLRAYRWQYIGSGVAHTRFPKVLGELVTPAQGQRVEAALAPLLAA
jgi:hypothetical protein